MGSADKHRYILHPLASMQLPRSHRGSYEVFYSALALKQLILAASPLQVGDCEAWHHLCTADACFTALAARLHSRFQHHQPPAPADPLGAPL